MTCRRIIELVSTGWCRSPLTNAARHGGARNVNVSLKRSDSRLQVKVQDDGSGFQKSKLDAKGLGLVGMEERVRELGGAFR